MTFGIDGLSSGLDSTSIINQLMRLERQPAVRLEIRTSVNNRAITALGALKTSMASVATAAKALNDPTTSFVPRIATSSAGHVTATASASAEIGSMTFSVEKLAGRHAVATDGVAASRDAVVNATGGDVAMSITVGATVHSITVANGTTLQQLADQINAVDGLDVGASLVDTGSGFKLQLASASSGAAGVFTTDLTALDATAFGGTTATQVLTQGVDAELLVGDGPGAYTVTSPTNTFNDLITGLSFTATAAKPAEQVTVAVQADPAALTAKVKTFVDAVNSALGEMDAHLKTSLKGATPGALAGNSAIRSMRDKLLNSVTYPVAGATLSSGGMVGIQSTNEGTLVFDEAKFSAAVTADPAAVEALFRSGDPAAPGIADRVLAHGEAATTTGTGIIATVVTARESENKSLATSIEAIDRRVELRRATLQRQFSNLEIVMGQMQAQQSWMSSQIGAMNANSA